MIASSSLGPFIGRFDKVLVASATGVETVPCSSVGLERRWSQHLDGVARLGLFPTLPTERCLFGVVDLDCHDRYTPDRHEEATRLVAFLARIGIAGYRVPSRGVRGAHVWLFFRPPGVPWHDLHAFLDAFACELRGTGHVDVFPRSTGAGGVFLPYYERRLNTFDASGVAVPFDRLAQNDPAVVPATVCVSTKGPDRSWPPREWSRRGGAGGEIPKALQDVKDLLLPGPDGLFRAKSGARSRLAGLTALLIAKRGGTFADLKRWDSANRPPLASDEPRALGSWWRCAERESERGRRP